MANEKCPELSPEPFHNFATDLIENGVVTITAVEDLLASDQLMLSLHLALDADNEAIRTVVEGVGQVRVGDRVFSVFCDIDPYSPSSFGRVTVFHEPPQDGMAGRIVQPTSLDEGIDRILTAALPNERDSEEGDEDDSLSFPARPDDWESKRDDHEFPERP